MQQAAGVLLIEVNPSRFKLQPYAHQLKGVYRLLKNPRYGLFWQMRLGKTKVVLDTACLRYEAGLLKTLVICCPAQVKPVWGHKEIGEARKHAFVDHKTMEFNSTSADYIDMLAQENEGLNIVLLSHELLRQEDRSGDFPRVYEMQRVCANQKTWLVYDEASAFGSHKSMQTKSALHLRKVLKPEWTTTLDGTPIGNHPVEQYSKFKLLGEDILGYKSFFHFRAVHQVAEPSMFAKRGKKFVGFQRQELIDSKVRPFCEYLEQKDALDMPEKVQSFMVARLSHKTWRVYKEMRDELCAQLDSGEVSVQHAAVKVLRLAQICSGFVGGVENEQTGEMQVQELSDETTDEVMTWCKARLQENEEFRCVIWARWRPELERLHNRLSKLNCATGIVYGAKKAYSNELHPDTPLIGGYILAAQPQALRYGTNLSKADTELFMSQDYNLVTRSQAVERIQAPNIRKTSSVVDVLVEGPDGQKTVVWDIKRALDEKESVASRTAGQWKKILTEE